MEYKDTNPRRNSKKNKKAKKRARLKKGFIAFLLIFFLCATLVTLSLTVFFKTEQITVSGNTIYQTNAILETAAIKTGTNMFLVFDSAVEKQLMAKHPFIESVKLKRTLPDKIEIIITEATEYYCYEYAGQFFTASKDNRVLAKYSSAPAGLVDVSAKSLTNLSVGKNVEFTNEEEKNYLTKLLNTLSEYKLEVTSVDVTDMSAIKVTISDRIVADFGGQTELEGKTAHLATLIENLDENVRGSVDLSVWTPTNNKAYFDKDNLQ